MSHKLNSAIAVIGIDIGKNSFHVVGHGSITSDTARADRRRSSGPPRKLTQISVPWACSDVPLADSCSATRMYMGKCHLLGDLLSGREQRRRTVRPNARAV
jgi:hypothetical protein